MTRRIVDAVIRKSHPVRLAGAGGAPRVHSDIDLLVVVDPTGPAGRYSEVSRAPFSAYPMDLLVRTPAEIETRLGWVTSSSAGFW